MSKGHDPWTKADFATKAPGLDWEAFWAAAELPNQQDFIVWQPKAVTGEAAPARCRNRSEEHTSELQSLMRISYAVFCLKKKKQTVNLTKIQQYTITKSTTKQDTYNK